MIKLATNEISYLSRVQGVEYYSNRLCENFNLYFKYNNLAQFYLVENYSALQVMGDTAVFVGEETTQLSSFFSFNMVNQIFSNNQNLNLCGYDKEQLNVIVYDNPPQDLQYNPQFYIDEIQVKDVISLWQNQKEKTQLEDAYSDLSMRRNHCNAKFFGGFIDNSLTCCVAVTCETETQVFFSFISTNKKFRNNGYAKQMLNLVAQKYKGKLIYLICNNKVEGFYHKCGFKTACHQYVYTLNSKEQKNDN